MPPKKGGKGAKGLIIDGVDTTSMTREQLEVFCMRIKEENEREREERNYFQMERDKLRTFWEITRNELEELKAKLRNKDRQIEEATEKNEEELRKYKQKVKHMQYEHQQNLTECKADALVSLKKAQDDYREQEKELLQDKRNLKSVIRDSDLAQQDQIKALKLRHSEEISNIRKEFQNKSKEVETKYEKKFQDLKNELNTKHGMEISEIEERKNNQITELTKHHEKAFNDMKNYYNDITLNNLALISSLKDQMEVLRKQNERMNKQVSDLVADNRRLTEPLTKANAEVEEYKRQLVNYEKDKMSLKNTKAKLDSTQKELADLRWAYDAMELTLQRIEAERDELKKRFVNAVLEVQQKTGVKNVLLQKRVQNLTESLESKELIVEDLQQRLGKPVSEKALETLVAKKNATISDLQYELARVCKAHDDLLKTYEEKLLLYGIPKEELGFKPLRIIPEGQSNLPRAPAGLITENR